MKLLDLLALCLTLLPGVQGADEHFEITCDPDVQIIGGMVRKSNGNEVGSILTYECPDRYHPFPVSSRRCRSTGQWTRLPHSVITANCKEFRCPTPILEDGMFNPVNTSYSIGETIIFECYDGYELLGSGSRTCMRNGRWNGTTTICNTGLQLCPHPGIPAGGRKTGMNYGFGDKVEYACNNQLVLVGSSSRKCLETGEWTGAAPSCQHKSSFDTPEEVASSFTASFTNMLGMTQTVGPNKPVSVARKFFLGKDAPLHIYILLDASQSVGELQFNEAKKVTINLIDKIASFDVRPRFGIITYASQPIVLADISNEGSSDPDLIIDLLNNSEKSKFSAHGDQRGTNIHEALKEVHKMMVFSKTQFKADWAKIRFVTILFTDGKSNMGGNPKWAADRIRHFVLAQNKTDDYLDMYTFGVSEDVDKGELNSLSSHKNGERHYFTVKNTTDLVKSFNDILDLSTIGNLCGVADENPTAIGWKRHPWHVVIRVPGIGSCSGSIVSQRYVLTAAHCLKEVHSRSDIQNIMVEVGDKHTAYRVKDIYQNPKYNLVGKQAANISQFYDYDAALIELKKELHFSATVRPICLPCTRETSRALRKPQLATTCQNQETELLPATGTVQAAFVKRGRSRSEGTEAHVTIKRSEATRKACEAQALHAPEYHHVKDVREVVTERFLCTGGQQPKIEAVSCKGDSGGSLYVHKRRRFFQVGIVSWGVIDVCGTFKPNRKHARDFHINLFKVLPWLKKQLGNIVTFIE
ncbi:complement factor B-like [Heptranchias perlo]|uniref:complement factor B-like n=1 Tax=Heptranchias perlo TaxID=212740 RepID=UPI00355A3AEE